MSVNEAFELRRLTNLARLGEALGTVSDGR